VGASPWRFESSFRHNKSALAPTWPRNREKHISGIAFIRLLEARLEMFLARQQGTRFRDLSIRGYLNCGPRMLRRAAANREVVKEACRGSPE
jgi:hypothetical protein